MQISTVKMTAGAEYFVNLNGTFSRVRYLEQTNHYWIVKAENGKTNRIKKSFDFKVYPAIGQTIR